MGREGASRCCGAFLALGTSSKDPHSPVLAGDASAQTTESCAAEVSCPGDDRDPPVTTATLSLSRDGSVAVTKKYVMITMVKIVAVSKV